MAATMMDASGADARETPLFSRKKYAVTPVSPAPAGKGKFRTLSFSPGARRFLIKIE
jgi:hypothetical protein